MLTSVPSLAINPLTLTLQQMGTSALSKSPAWRGGSARCWPAVVVLKWERCKEWRRGQSKEEALQLPFLVPHPLKDNSSGACILGQPMQLTPTMTLRWFSPSGVKREDAVYAQALWNHIQHVSQEQTTLWGTETLWISDLEVHSRTTWLPCAGGSFMLPRHRERQGPHPKIQLQSLFSSALLCALEIST